MRGVPAGANVLAAICLLMLAEQVLAGIAPFNGKVAPFHKLAAVLALSNVLMVTYKYKQQPCLKSKQVTSMLVH